MAEQQAKVLAEKHTVKGPIQYRDQAETAGAVWNLSGQQSDTISEANGALYGFYLWFLDLSRKAQEVAKPPCSRLNLKCKRARKAADRELEEGG